MDAILHNITDPSWWFTGLFFVGIAFLFPKLIPLIMKLLEQLNGCKKRSKLKALKKIKSVRFDDCKVIVEGVKASTWQVVFVITMLLFFYNFLFTSLQTKFTGLTLIIFSIPVYIVEVIYLTQDEFYKRLLTSRDKIH
jgi:hypothetical protein